MSPWTVLEWVVSVGLSVLVAVVVIATIAIGTKYLVQLTSTVRAAKAEKAEKVAVDKKTTTK
jgi:hypothetical protein